MYMKKGQLNRIFKKNSDTEVLLHTRSYQRCSMYLAPQVSVEIMSSHVSYVKRMEILL